MVLNTKCPLLKSAVNKSVVSYSLTSGIISGSCKRLALTHVFP